jgi:hypothetical protein
MSASTHLVMGLQGSGKTTFAAALWYLVDMGEVDTSLVKGTHRGDFRYLESIARDWAEGWQVKRTGTDQIEPVSINLRHPGTVGDIALEFADLSGEAYEHAFSRRLATPEFLELAQKMDGLLIFVSANRHVDGITIADAAVLAPELAAQESDGHDDPETEWDPDKTPQQVQLADLLQILGGSPHGKRPSRIVVIVSAWDLVPDHFDPDIWLQQRMPLIDQFLRAHAEEVPYRVYGVSAQGGRVPKREEPNATSDRRDLLRYARPSTRIKVVGHGAGQHDLTHPIRWLSGLERSDGVD